MTERRDGASRGPAAPRRAGPLVAGAIMLVPAIAAAVQPTTRPQRVDPAVADTGPLGVSLRSLRTDLRQSPDFSEVVRVPAGTFSRPRGGFARRAGALTAVFPRSVYVPGGGGGLIPVIPPGTIFHLGDPAPAGRAPASRHLSPNYADLLVPAGAQGARDLRLDERRDTLIGAAEPAPAGASDDSEGAGTPSVFTDDGYRARRLDDLIRAAAATPAADAPTP